MFSETDRVWARHFLGYAGQFVQADLRCENALTGIQSISDGGSRPDSSSEAYIKACIYGFAASTGVGGVTVGPTPQDVTFSYPAQRGLIQIEAQIAQLDAMLGASEVDGDIKVNPARETARLRMEGRRVVTAMATMLGVTPRRDVFSSIAPNPSGDSFYHQPDGLGDGYQW